MALVKYWGKRDDDLVLPHTGSISMTLDALTTETEVEFFKGGRDEVLIDGKPARPEEVLRTKRILEVMRHDAVEPSDTMRVTSKNNFPTAGGLASSASGFAALVAAASWALNMKLTPSLLSIYARCASGSACRSIFGGFAEWTRGEDPNGVDSYARQILAPEAWDVGMAIAIVDVGRKETSSRDAMKQSVLTSPFFDAWVKTTATDVEEARAGILSRDVEKVGEIAERSFLKMHATAMTSDPPAIFWKPPTLALIDRIRKLREESVGAWATIDAGPHVAAFCMAADLPKVAKALGEVAGVREVVQARPGPGVERL